MILEQLLQEDKESLSEEEMQELHDLIITSECVIDIREKLKNPLKLKKVIQWCIDVKHFELSTELLATILQVMTENESYVRKEIVESKGFFSFLEEGMNDHFMQGIFLILSVLHGKLKPKSQEGFVDVARKICSFNDFSSLVILALMLLSNMSGGDEVIKLFYEHSADLYDELFKILNEQRKDFLHDILFFLSTMIKSEVCDKMIYQSDFQCIMNALSRELINYTQEDPNKLFDDYCATVIDIAESESYTKNFDQYHLTELIDIMNDIIQDDLTSENAKSCASLVIKTLESVQQRVE